MRILVAEDDAVTRRILQVAVERAGHECAVAADGEQAWALYLRLAPDALISDWMMPGMDGPELCRRVRSDEERGYCYIILLSALTDRDHVLAGMRAGADDYLTKPLQPRELDLRLIAAARVTELHRRLAAQRAELERLSAEHYEDARSDALLAIGNRRRLLEDLSGLAARTERYGHAYCVALCDIDNFKHYNDAFGHPAGDAVLQAVARALVRTCRRGDTVYRYGGEELVVVLPGQDLASAVMAAQRLRAAVEALAVAHPGNPPADVVTVSIGVAPVGEADPKDPAALLRPADAALYRAKEGGRNRVEVAGEAAKHHR
jgi:two-component system, cell cycle response regulator